jgi:hypothetical protein
MKTNDINLMKGKVKDAVLTWVDAQIDCLLPNKAAGRSLLKNAANNILTRYDEKINKGMDAAFILFADKDGKMDSDTIVDSLCSMLDEMTPSEYAFYGFEAKIGSGEICVDFPRSFLSELIAGDIGGVKITSADIKQIKDYLK